MTYQQRIISSEQIEQAMKNPDNIKILNKVIGGFSKVLDVDERKRVALHATWNALRKHQECYGTKFTSSLYRHAKWECNKELKRKTQHRMVELPPHLEFNNAQQKAFADLVEHMDMLTKPQQRYVEKYYLYNMTMEEIAADENCSTETVRQRLKKAVQRLKCLVGVSEE